MDDKTNKYSGLHKIKILQIGLGGFGIEWFRDILPSVELAEIAGVVTSKPEKQKWAMDIANLSDKQVFSNLEIALDEIRPDVLLNVTPPEAHFETTRAAMRRGITVICEKPIALTSEDAFGMLEMRREYGIPLIIAENYRYFSAMRLAKQVLAGGELGRIDSVFFDFFRNHIGPSYHVNMEHPMLLDISIHHFDCMRFLLEEEIDSVSAKAWINEWSLYRKNANVVAEMTTNAGVHISYRGGLSYFYNETPWVGNWRIEAEKGVMKIADDKVCIVNSKGTYTLLANHDVDSRKVLMNDALSNILCGRKCETEIGDNIKTFQLVQAAIKSSDNNGKPVKINK